jgi:hypothetical protein
VIAPEPSREPIVGWRQWNFMYPHFLANLGNDTIYVPREKIEARCEQYSTIGTLAHPKDHSEPAPHVPCTCGIYAYKEKSRLLREIKNIYSGLRLVANNRYVPIYGEINLWGKVRISQATLVHTGNRAAGWLDWLCIRRAMRSNAVGRRRRDQNQITGVFHEICLRPVLSRWLLSEVFCAEPQGKTKRKTVALNA